MNPTLAQFLEHTIALLLAAVAAGGGFALVAAAIVKFFGEPWLKSRFDRSLAQFNSELRQGEDRLKATLKASDDREAALRSALLNGIAGGSLELDKRRLDALEKIWSAAVERRSMHLLAKFAESIDLEALMKGAHGRGQEAEGCRQMAEALLKTCNLLDHKPHERPLLVQPFVSESVWAAYSAYSSVLISVFAKMQTARFGIDPDLYNLESDPVEIVRLALPSFSKFIDEHGRGGLPYLVEPLEQNLLAEIRAQVRGVSDDDASIARARSILEALQRLPPLSAKPSELPAEIRGSLIDPSN